MAKQVAEDNPEKADGRDPKTGRFLKGNRGGPGNPDVRIIAEHRKALREAISREDLIDVLHKLRDLAKDGDVAAARVLFERCYGRPREEPPEAIFDLPSLSDSGGVAAVLEAVFEAQAAGRIDSAHANALCATLEKYQQSVTVERLVERMDALEGKDA